MSTAEEFTPSPRLGALAALVVAAILLACLTGLARYLSEREHQGEQLQTLLEQAESLGALQSRERLRSAEALMRGGAEAVDVLLAGSVDAFGIERGAEHAIRLRRGGAAAPDEAEVTALHRPAWLLWRQPQRGKSRNACATRLRREGLRLACCLGPMLRFGMRPGR